MTEILYRFVMKNDAVVALEDQDNEGSQFYQTGLNEPIEVSRAFRSVIDVVRSNRHGFTEHGYQQVIAFLLLVNVYDKACSTIEDFEKMYEVTLSHVSTAAIGILLSLLQKIETSEITFQVSRAHYKEIRDISYALWEYMARTLFVRATS